MEERDLNFVGFIYVYYISLWGPEDDGDTILHIYAETIYH